MMPNMKDFETQIPYVPFATFWNALDKLEEDKPPEKVDASVFPTYSGGATSQLLAAFRFLGLIDGAGVPTSDLETLVNKDTRKDTLKRLVEGAYAQVLSQFDISRASPSQLDDAIKAYGIQGTTHRKACNFLLKALEEAGIEISNHLRAKRRGRPSVRPSSAATNGEKPKVSRKRARQSKKLGSKTSSGKDADPWRLRVDVGEKGFAEFTVNFDPFDIPPEQRSALLKIVDSFRKFADKWSNEEKEAGK